MDNLKSLGGRRERKGDAHDLMLVGTLRGAGMRALFIFTPSSRAQSIFRRETPLTITIHVLILLAFKIIAAKE